MTELRGEAIYPQAPTGKVHRYDQRGIPIDPRLRRQSSTDRLGRLAMLVVVTLVLILPISTVSRAGTFTFPVQSEQAITGTTTGLGGAQTDDGAREILSEIDTAPDSVTAPAAQTLTTGTMAGGTFPGDVSSADGVFVQYRETAAYNAKVAAFNIGTGVAGTTVPVTGVGFLPKVVLFWQSGRTTSTDSVGPANEQRGFGTAVSPTDRRAVCSRSRDGQVDGIADTAHRADAAICSFSGGAIAGLADLSSMDPDGFTLIIDDPFVNDLRIHYVALGGSTLTNAATGMFTESGTTGNQDITTVGFQPDAVIFMSAMIGADPPGTAVDSTMMVGFAAGAGNPNDIVWAGGSNDAAATTQTQSYHRAGESIALFDAAITLTNGRGEVDAWLSNGFSLNWNEVAGSRRIHYLALKGGSYVVGDLLTRTTTGTIAETGFGFSPKASLFLSHNKAQSTVDTGQAHDELSIGAFSSTTDRGAQCLQDEDNVATSDVGTAVEHDEVYCNLDTNTAIEGLMGVQSVDSDGFTLVMDDPDPAASFVGYITFGGSTTMEVRYDWSGVPAGDSYLLSVKGYRGDEDFNVQVLTPPSTWTTRITVNSLTNQLFTAGMTLSEYNGGSPQVRFVDALQQDGSVSDLFLDWVGVTTVRLMYSLEVRQNVTGIMTGSNPILVVKGNITGGGENFHLYVWNFTSASWGLLLAAPFTPTNAYHNASLAADHLSGGTVRIRFVDAGSLDSTRWALSLDFVAVVITNDQPALTNAGVSPASGYITTSFTFFVRYSDSENNAPAFVNLTLDGISYAMVENNSADTNYVDGKDYFLNRVIGIRGTFNYSFSARASAGDLTLAATPLRQLSVLNRAPSISNPITSDAVHPGRSYARDFNGTDLDDDTLAWSASTNASWLTIGSANGTVWGVAPPDIRSFYANLSVSDGFGGFAWLNYTLSVGNLPPSITTVVANMALARRAFFSYDMNASDPDFDPLIWSLRTNASFLAMDPGSGTLFGIVSSVPSSYWIEVTVSDGLGGIDLRNFSLAVVNRPPAIFVSAPSTAETGASYSGSFSGTDPDDDPLSWSLTTNATWLLIDAATGQLYGTPSLGTYFANLSGRDPYGGVAFQNFTITVQGQSTTPPPDSPPGLRSEWWMFSLIALLFGLLIAIVMPRRRPIIESAFLIDQTGRVRLEFAIRGTPYDEGRLQSTLRGVSWKGLGRVIDPPYTLHIKPDPSGDWIFVSRTSDTDWVMKSAEKLISKMQGDVTSRKKPRLSERSS